MPRLCLPTDPVTVSKQLWYAMKAEVESRYCAFESNDQLIQNTRMAAQLLTSGEDKRFGIMLNGFTGTGKTIFAKALQRVINHYQLVVDPEATYIQKYDVKMFSAKNIWKRGLNNPDVLAEIQNYPVISIDDLGEDAKEAVSYGNVLTPMVDLFEYRYARRLFTITTTNLDPNELRQKYGERVASRLAEMMLTLTFTHRDHRVSVDPNSQLSK